MARHLGASQVNSPHCCRGVPRGSIRGSVGLMEQMHNSGAISGAVSQSAACSKRKFSLHSGSARTKMAAHLTHVFTRTPPCCSPSTLHPKLSKENVQIAVGKEGKRMYVRSSFLRFPAISAENSHCEKAKSSTAAAQPFLPDCKKVFHLISGSVRVCVCVCMLASVYSRVSVCVCV